MLQMTKVHARRYMIFAAVLAAFVLVVWAGCSKDLMSPDEEVPENSAITNPVHMSSLNRETINVRGRAEVGATIRIYVNDDDYENEPAGTALSSPAIPNDGLGGRYTVEGVSLGEEGMKSIRARVTDLYGNEVARDDAPTVTIILDQTAPPVGFEGIEGAVWDTVEGNWNSGLPSVTVSGSTDTSASGARLRAGLNEYVATEFDELPDGVLHFSIDVPSPPLSGGHADTLMNYYIESFDAAGNLADSLLVLRWEVEGREEELLQDDGDYGNHDNTLQLWPGERVAVKYQAPTWANYVTKFLFYNANDQETNPGDPQAPTSEPFLAWVWRTTIPDSMPGHPGNDENGYMPFPEKGMYPENEWITVTFPNAVNINDNSQYPNKTFFVGMQWMVRENPRVYEDHSEPLGFKTFLYDFVDGWERHDWDTMIRAVVSDVPSLDGKGREVVLAPVRVRR
jgi:hypothetical protein